MLISKMKSEECREFLARQGIGRLACTRDGQPYIVPIYFICESDHLYGFTTPGRKVEWMRENPLVCVQADEVVSEDKWTSIVVLGRYEELSTGNIPRSGIRRNHCWRNALRGG